jgi:predicted lactoylglutathione lyase
MTVPAAISLVTLGVRDVAVATRFYEQLGFPRSSASVEGEVSFFRTAGALLAVRGAGDLARDAAADATTSDTFRGVALAINVDSEAAVDEALATAQRVGGRIVRAAARAEWGGYQGYFADPDGHHWEIAHNPHWPLDPNGLPQLPD